MHGKYGMHRRSNTAHCQQVCMRRYTRSISGTYSLQIQILSRVAQFLGSQYFQRYSLYLARFDFEIPLERGKFAEFIS